MPDVAEQHRDPGIQVEGGPDGRLSLWGWPSGSPSSLLRSFGS